MFLTIFTLAVFTSPVLTASLGETCSNSTECPDDNYECVKSHPVCTERVCLCKDGYDVMQESCLRVANLGEDCTAETICIPNILSTCSESTNKCVCNFGLTEVDGECVTGSKLLTQPCINHGECSGFSASEFRVYCGESGTCQCWPDFVEYIEKDECRYPAQGDSCSNRTCFNTYNCAQDSTCQCETDLRQIEMAASFSTKIRIGVDRIVGSICVANNVNADVDVGGECQMPDGPSAQLNITKVCKATLDCEYCSSTGPYYCVERDATTSGDATTGGHVTTGGGLTGGDATTGDGVTRGEVTTAGAASGRVMLLMIPLILLISVI